MSKKKDEQTKVEKEVSEDIDETRQEDVEDTKSQDSQKKEEKPLTKEEELSNQLESQKQQYLRLAAEYDNYRKRTQSEKLLIYDDATAKAVEEILPIADSITMAMASMQDKDIPEEFTKGIELIGNQLKSSFDKLQITAFGEAGDAFDPQIHNAISKIEDDSLAENTVSAVYQTGYKIKDRIIRHAMVVVANCD